MQALRAGVDEEDEEPEEAAGELRVALQHVEELRLRQLDDKHNFTLVCRDLSQIGLFAKVDTAAFRLLKNHTPGPYTFILNATREVPRMLLHPKRRTIGIRVPSHPIALALLEQLGEPLMSVSLIMPGDELVVSGRTGNIEDFAAARGD